MGGNEGKQVIPLYRLREWLNQRFGNSKSKQNLIECHKSFMLNFSNFRFFKKVTRLSFIEGRSKRGKLA